MREYQVPFSTREEEPFIFGLKIREMLWLGGGFFVGFIASAVVFFIIGAELQNLIICLPAIIPFAAAGLYLSKKKVKEDDHFETMDKHLIKKVKYMFKAHNYINYR